MGMNVGTKGPQSEINVTPLVDVVLVLLIIFIVVTPMLQKGQDVLIPEAPHADNKETKRGEETLNNLIISITFDEASGNHAIWLGDELVSEDNLLPRLSAHLLADPFLQILIKGDKRLSYSMVLPVMEACAEAGAKTVAMMTDKNTPSQPGIAASRGGS